MMFYAEISLLVGIAAVLTFFFNEDATLLRRKARLARRGPSVEDLCLSVEAAGLRRWSGMRDCCASCAVVAIREEGRFRSGDAETLREIYNLVG